MAERDRTDDDDDLEFEFFDEPRTVEAPTRIQPPRRGPGPPGEPPVRPRTPGSGTPIIRLAALVGGAIVIAVALVFGITSCRGGKSKGEFQGYLQSVAAVTRQSDDIGGQLATTLATPGLSLDDLQTKLDGLAQQQAQVVARASNLSPPGALLDEQRALVEVMQLRANGLRGMKQATSQIQPATDATTAGKALAAWGSRLVAADVVYSDLFKGPSESVLKTEGISGLAVPASSFLDDPAVLSSDSLSQLIARINQGGPGGGAGGKHGDGIAGVKILPSGQDLQTGQDNVVIATEKLQIQVLVKNSGDFQETQVEVSLTIQQNPQIKKTETIPVIDKGQTKSVTFGQFSNLQFATAVVLKVSVKPVPGETNRTNNSAEYSVIFNLK